MSQMQDLSYTERALADLGPQKLARLLLAQAHKDPTLLDRLKPALQPPAQDASEQMLGESPIMQRLRQSLVTALLEQVAPGTLSSEERSVVTMALLGMINFTFTWLRPDGPVSYDRFADIATTLWLDGLTGLAPHPAEPSHEQAIRIQG